MIVGTLSVLYYCLKLLICSLLLDCGEGLNLLGNASFANENQQTGFGEPGKRAPRGDQTTPLRSARVLADLVG